MNQNDWIEWYVQHGGNRDLMLDGRERVLFHPEHGFTSFLIHDDVLEVHHMAGDGKFWVSHLKKVMKVFELKKIHMFTRRNPKAWIRKYGGRITGYYMEADYDELKI